MTMAPGLRRLTFTTHIASSISWVGAALTFLALAGIGLTSPDDRVVRGVYLVMAPTAWFVLVPLAHASLLSGIALALGTTWGLFRHYWVVLKLLITVFSTAILLVYMRTFEEMAGIAADPNMALGHVRNPSPLVHAILAVILLVAATLLSVYKPLGVTAYGRRKQEEQRHASSTTPEGLRIARAPNASAPRWMYVLMIIAAGIVVLLLLLHFTGTGLHH